MAYEELQVPGEPGVWFCDKHRKTTTRLRCGRCERPICPKCTVMGPTGARCRACLSNRSSHIYQVSLPQFVLTFFLSGILGAVLGVVTGRIGAFWLFALFYAPALGPLLGKIVTTITRGKRGSVLASVTIAGMAVGALIAGFLGGDILNPLLYLVVGIAAVTTWGFLK